MVLDFEYGINTGNRFLDLVDHDEDPDVFIANQTHPEGKPKEPTKDAKKETTKSKTKSAEKPATSSTTPSTNKPTSATTTKTNKENVAGKSSTNDQQKQQQQTNFSPDNNTQNNQQTRPDSGRGGRGFGRRGGSAGQDRPPREGFHRGGGGQQRGQRFNKFEGQSAPMETGTFEQSAEHWDNQNQTHTGYRGRGGPRRGYYEGGRGMGRGRGRGGRGGRGYPSNRTFEEGPHEQQPRQENVEQQPIVESNIDNTRIQSAPVVPGQDFDTNVLVQEVPFEGNEVRRGRGHFRARVFRSNRNFGDEHQNEDELGQKHYRQNRRQNDRQPRTYVSGVKPFEKRQGEGAYNWGKPTDNPEEPAPEGETTDQAETTEPAAAAAAEAKGWAQQVDEAEKQMTLDEYKKQIEAKKQAQHEKLPQFNRRVANEGEDPKTWQNFKHVYRKKNEGEEGSEEEVVEEASEGEEENQSEDENEEHLGGKKKIITIPLRFKPIEFPRGGPRRGSGRMRSRPYGDDRRRSNSPNQQQSPSSYQAGEYQNDEQQGKPYGGGSRRGLGRGEFRRVFRNSARGGYNRSNAGPSAPDFANAADFPTLHKQ